MGNEDFFSEVKTGDAIPSLCKEAVFLGSTYRFPALFGGIKLESDTEKAARKAKELSVDDIHTSNLFGGVYLLQFISQMLTSWLPNPRGWLQGGKISAKFIKPVRMGETVTCKGQVKGKDIKDGKRYLVCDVWVENCDGQSVVVGEAAIKF